MPFVEIKQRKIRFHHSMEADLWIIQLKKRTAEIQGINLNRTAPGMGGLGIDRGGNAALAEVHHDPVGIAHSGMQLKSQLLGGDLVRGQILHDGDDFLERHGRKTAALCSFADIGLDLCRKDHIPFRVQRPDQTTVAVDDKGTAGDLGLLGGDLNIVHGMGNSSAHTVGYQDREIQQVIQMGGKPAGLEFVGQEPQNLHRGDENTAVVGILEYTFHQVGFDELLNVKTELFELIVRQGTGLAGENLNDHRMIVVLFLKFQLDQNLLDQNIQMLVGDKGTAVRDPQFLKAGNDTAVLADHKIDGFLFPKFCDSLQNEVFNGVTVCCADGAGQHGIVSIYIIQVFNLQKIGNGIAASDGNEKIHGDPAQIHALGIQHHPKDIPVKTVGTGLEWNQRFAGIGVSQLDCLLGNDAAGKAGIILIRMLAVQPADMLKIVIRDHMGLAGKIQPGQRIHGGLIKIVACNKQQLCRHDFTSGLHYIQKYSLIQWCILKINDMLINGRIFLL